MSSCHNVYKIIVFVLDLKMKKNTVAAITAVVVVFTNNLCAPAESVENVIDHKYCHCLNVTADIRLIKCKCVDNKLKEIPKDLPTPLHEL